MVDFPPLLGFVGRLHLRIAASFMSFRALSKCVSVHFALPDGNVAWPSHAKILVFDLASFIYNRFPFELCCGASVTSSFFQVVL